MITIVDYGMGNVGSIVNMLKRIGVASYVACHKNEIEGADKIILPGVGAFDAAMERLESNNMIDALNQKALNEKVPVLGICLGMQLMTKGSEEGHRKGLGWIDAYTKKFSVTVNGYKIPHMGWNTVQQKQNIALVSNIPDDARFYFVHSYYVQTANSNDTIASTRYSCEFDSMITNGTNLFGVQFHPEKSHKFGMKIFENFAVL